MQAAWFTHPPVPALKEAPAGAVKVIAAVGWQALCSGRTAIAWHTAIATHGAATSDCVASASCCGLLTNTWAAAAHAPCVH